MSQRWRYMKHVDDESGKISRLFRVRGSDVEELQDGNWVSCPHERWPEVDEDNGRAWLTSTEAANLRTYLRCGQDGIPERLDLEIPECYMKWKCPNCDTFTIVPMIVGYPDMEAAEAERRGDIILVGCTIFGDEPDRPVGCTGCEWRGEHVRGRTIRITRPPARP